MSEDELVDEVAKAMMTGPYTEFSVKRWGLAGEVAREKWRSRARHALARIRELREEQHR